MAKNTIGKFIAALRKANGMTQQEVADRLNVSNKAVSRWERDECLPDLMLIPALAEMFGVSCDELLKGERISNRPPKENGEARVEKQRAAMINKALLDFKTMSYIAIALAALGLICMFGIAYGFYRSSIAFAVMMIFEAAAVTLGVLALSRAKGLKDGSELLKDAPAEQIERFEAEIAKLSFAVFFAAFAVILLSLPLVVLSGGSGVLSIYSYFTLFFVWIAALIALVWLKCKEPYSLWLTGGKRPQKVKSEAKKLRKRMNLLQTALVLLGAAVLFAATYIYNNDTLYTLTIIAGLFCLAASVLCFAIFVIKFATERRNLLLAGIRNAFLIPSAVLMNKIHSVGTTGYFDDDGAMVTVSYNTWYEEYFFLAVLLALAVFITFALIEAIIEK